MNQTEISEVLRKHKLWLQGKGEGERANLMDAKLIGAKLSGANLISANLRDANLRDANLRDANLRDANLRDANLRDANLSGANLSGANLRDANLRDANLSGANLSGADIDYSAWPLWCGSLKAHVDDRIAVQLLYHTLSVVQHSPYVSEEIKRTLLTSDVVEVANRFHRIAECGKLSVHEQEVSE